MNKETALYLMVGNIASGKTTWIKSNIQSMNDTVVLSADHLRYMLVPGKYTWNPNYESVIWKHLYSLAKDFLYKYNSVIIDCCNMSIKNRKDWVKLAKDLNCRTVAIVTKEVNMQESIKRRINDNHGETSASVWKTIYTSFKLGYQVPTLDEGFDEIIKL